jgi:hypothetical protein
MLEVLYQVNSDRFLLETTVLKNVLGGFFQIYNRRPAHKILSFPFCFYHKKMLFRLGRLVGFLPQHIRLLC